MSLPHFLSVWGKQEKNLRLLGSGRRAAENEELLRAAGHCGGRGWSAGSSPHMMPEKWLGGSVVKATGTKADPHDQDDKTSPTRPIRARKWKALGLRCRNPPALTQEKTRGNSPDGVKILN